MHVLMFVVVVVCGRRGHQAQGADSQVTQVHHLHHYQFRRAQCRTVRSRIATAGTDCRFGTDQVAAPAPASYILGPHGRESGLELCVLFALGLLCHFLTPIVTDVQRCKTRSRRWTKTVRR